MGCWSSITKSAIVHSPTRRPTTSAALIQLAGIAAAAFAPTVLAASPALLQVEEFADLAMALDISDPFRPPEFARWRSLSAREDMRFIGVTLPRVLARPPWEDDPARVDGFRYAEYAPEISSRVWMTAGYAFAAVVARAFDNHAWPADVRGCETDFVGGGLVTDLADRTIPHRSRSSLGSAAARPRTVGPQEAALVEAGLMPLSVAALRRGGGLLRGAQPAGAGQLHRPHRGRRQCQCATFGAAQFNALRLALCSLHQDHGPRNGRLFQDGRGDRNAAAVVADRLRQHATSRPDRKAGRAFRSWPARVSVRELPGRPGVFGCTMHLQPHFQLDDVAATFRLVTDIAAPGAHA